jgi:hypothetical protein
MKAVIKKFENRIKDLTEEEILDLSKHDHSIFNVLRDLHKEAFGTYVWDDSKPNFDYYLTYVTKVNGKIDGVILKLQPHIKDRNELITCLSAFICQRYGRKNPHEVFNEYQDQQRSLFERQDYWTYGNELAEELKGKNGDFILKGHRGILFVPFADNPQDAQTKDGSDKKGKTKPSSRREIQYVYLMLNKQNRYHKIGRSIKPEHREKTLQGQEPDVELIEKWIASAEVEKILHRKYKDKRKRGEWFDLVDTDIIEIKLFMQTILSKSKRDE